MIDTERYLDDLDRWLALAARGRVEPAADRSFADTERLAELFRDEVLRDVLAQLRAESPAVANLIGDAAGTWRLAELLAEVERVSGEPLPCGGAGPPTWSEAGYWLAAASDPASRAAARDGLERAGERVASADRDVQAGRHALAVRLGGAPPWEAWARARGRGLPEVAATARILLGATPVVGLPGQEASGSGRARRPAWVDIPWLLATVPGAGRLPAADGQLLRFVADELGVGRLFEDRVRVQMGPAAPPRAAVVVVRPAQQVHMQLRLLGPPRDYRVALRMLGRALYHAGIEDAAGVHARCLDPAVAACFGALLESLPRREAWRRRLLPGGAPAPVARSFAAQCRWRLRMLAAEVEVATAMPGDSSPHGLLGLGPTGREAVGLDHPAVPLPWSPCAGEAADEFVGWILAAEIEERLASRYGRDWTAKAAAGAWLRDLWAAAHPTAAALAGDLGMTGLGDVGVLVERWFHGVDT